MDRLVGWWCILGCERKGSKRAWKPAETPVREINISQTFWKTFANLGRLEYSRNKEINRNMNENAFSYTYSAAYNQEVLNIRNYRGR